MTNEEGVNTVDAGAAEDKGLSPDLVKAYLETEDGARLLQPILDRTVTKALQTREKNIEEKVEAELRRRLAAEKLAQEESPTDKRLREIQERLDAAEKKAAKEALMRQLTDEAAKLGIPTKFLEWGRPESYEEGLVYLKEFKALGDEISARAAKETLGTAYKPGGSSEKAGKVDLTKLSQAELMKLEMEGKLDQLMAAQ